MTDHDDVPQALRDADARIRALRGEPLPRTADGGLDIAAIFGAIPEPTPEELEREERKREAREERRAKAEADALRAKRKALVERFPVKRDIVDAIIDDGLGPTKAIEVVRRWADSRPKPVLLLLGGVGCGKTVAAAWLAAHVTREDRFADVSYAKMRDVANLYRAGFGEDAKAFESLLRAGLLIIDELTTERDADLGRAALHEVVDERGSRGWPTLLLANRTKQEIRERYDARTIDRLREGAVVVELADKSLRRGQW